MVGTLEQAMQAVEGNLKYLGEGCFRSAWINDSRDVVYKIGVSTIPWGPAMYLDNNSNENEYASWEELSVRDDIPEDLVIPEITQYHAMGVVVNALPFVDGRPASGCVPRDIADFFSRVGLTDSGHDNVLVTNDGKYHLVDMEMYW